MPTDQRIKPLPVAADGEAVHAHPSDRQCLDRPGIFQGRHSLAHGRGRAAQFCSGSQTVHSGC